MLLNALFFIMKHIILLILVVLPSTAQAQSNTCKISYQSDFSGNMEIYVMDSDGMNKSKITNNAAMDGGPTWSPDGNQVAFWSNRDGQKDIYVMDSDGGNVQRLTTGAATDEPPSWSTTGKIAYYANPDGQKDIYVMDSDGGNVQRLTTGAATDSAPAWSPDGSKIAFQSTRDGNYEIYVMDSDGSNVQRLTNHGEVDSAPSWSPDGSKIAFFSRRDGHWETYVMDSDGGNLTPFFPPDSFEDYRAVWKNNTVLIFQSNRWGGADQIAMSDGSNITQITTNGGERADVWCTSSSSSPVATIFPTPITITTLPLTNTMTDIADEITSLWNLNAPEAFGTGGLLFSVLLFAMVGILKRFVSWRYEEDE